MITAISRVFLALDKVSTAVVAVVIGAIILGIGFFVAYRPHLLKDATPSSWSAPSW